MKVKKNQLENFSKKLIGFAQHRNMADDLASVIAENGEKIAKSNAGGIAVSVQGSANTRQITMSGVGLRYTEFGTGIIGEGTYDGSLPTETIKFTSGDKEWETKGWQYAYRNKQQPKLYPKPHKGRIADMPMYRTSVELREWIKTNLKKEFKK